MCAKSRAEGRTGKRRQLADMEAAHLMCTPWMQAHLGCCHLAGQQHQCQQHECSSPRKAAAGRRRLSGGRVTRHNYRRAARLLALLLGCAVGSTAAMLGRAGTPAGRSARRHCPVGPGSGSLFALAVVVSTGIAVEQARGRRVGLPGRRNPEQCARNRVVQRPPGPPLLHHSEQPL